jgi:elongation factor P
MALDEADADLEQLLDGLGVLLVDDEHDHVVLGLDHGVVVGKPDIDEREMQYLYREGDHYNFMDNKTYEQTFVTAEQMGDAKNFIKENTTTHILFFNGKAIGVTLPNSMDLKVAKCDPGVRGDTVSGATKPATLETGYVVNVPLFIEEGETLRIDTRTGEYLTRVAG